MKRIYGLLLGLIIVLTAGCGLQRQSDESGTESGVAKLFENSGGDTDSEDTGEDVSCMDLVTVEEFMAYYVLTEADIEGYDVEGLIDDHCITSDSISDADWYDMLKRDARLGKKYGCNLDRIIWKYKRKATEQDDFRKARYIVYEVEIDNINGCDSLVRVEDVVIDVQERKVYYLCKLSDYFDAEKVKDLDDETFDKIFDIIEDMELPEWESNMRFPEYDVVYDYRWSLHIVMTKKDVIRCMGNMPGEDVREETFDELKALVDAYCK